jgi:PadR family transcriptional regulator PadR
MSGAEPTLQTLPKACHEALILAVLAGGARHGYEIALEVEARSGGALRFRHGTLYPLLHRLEAEGRVTGAWSDEGPRGKRKAYALTPAGREHAARQRAGLAALFETLLRATAPAEETA